jgi:DNA-binding NtrC family response regulator
LLEHYPWRGNVRELEAVLERAMIFKSGDWITPEDLDLPMRRGSDVTEGAAAAERHGLPGAKAVLSWLQHEALRIVSERREVRRSDIVARCRISREVARRELVGLVRLGLLRRIGFGRGARYVALSWWFTMMSDAAEWAMALV